MESLYGPADPRVELSEEERSATCHLAGRLDLYFGPKFHDLLDEIAANRAVDNIVLDMSDVELIDSTCLGVIVAARNDFMLGSRDMEAPEIEGRSFCIANPTPSIRKVLEISGVERIIEVVEESAS